MRARRVLLAGWALGLSGAAGMAVSMGCASHPPPEEEFTPQIRVVPGAASRSLWIGHKGLADGGDAQVTGPLAGDGGANVPP